MIRYVFLDLDDTILDFQRAEANALKKTIHTLTGEDCDEAVLKRYSEINAAQWRRLEKGELTYDEVKLVRFSILFEELGISASATLAKNVYEKNLSVGHFFVDGAPKLLQSLYGKYALYLASNGTRAVQESRIASAGIARYFDEIFISEVMGYAKPQKGFFDACFARIPTFDPAQAIILGDSLTSDMLGGYNAGILTCWFNPHQKECTGAVKPHFTISKLSQFPPLLESISHT